MTMNLIVLVLVLLFVGCDGKGAGGSTSGGSYRSTKNGYYSRGHYYGYYPIYIGHHHYGTRGHYSSDSTRQAANLDNKQNKIFCKRDVRLDSKSYTSADAISFNSTRDCFIQVSTDHGSPKNEKVLESELDVFQWKMMAGNNLFGVEMQQFKDMDDAAPVDTSKFGVYIESIASDRVVDLRSLTWKSSNLAPADKSTFGYPRSTSKDNSRILTVDTRGKSADGTVDITFSYSIAADFAEDPFIDHVFFRPSGMKMDVTVSKFPGVVLNSGGGGQLTFKMYVRAKADFEPSYGKPTAELFATEYDAQKRMRIEIGNVANVDTRGRNFFSWGSQVSQESVCYKEGGEFCAVPNFGTCNTASQCKVLCDNTANNAVCAKAGGVTGDWVLPFEITGMVGTNENRTYIMTWSTTIGTYDKAEFTTIEPNSASSAAISFVLIAISVLLIL